MARDTSHHVDILHHCYHGDANPVLLQERRGKIQSVGGEGHFFSVALKRTIDASNGILRKG